MKISKEQHASIIKELETKSQKSVAQLYEVSQTTIGNIARKYNIQRDIARLNTCRRKCDFDYFKTIDSKEKAYWLGFICADGCILQNYTKVTLQVKDKEIIDKFKIAIKSDHPVSFYNKMDKRTGKQYDRYVLSINGKEFRQNLINVGISYDKTDNLNIPNIDEKYYSYFFAGLFDGDGSVSNTGKVYTKNGKKSWKYKCRISLISTKEVLEHLILYIQNKLGVKELKLTKVTKNKANVWKMHLYKEASIFLDWIYQDSTFSYLTRKYIKYLDIKKGENLLCQIKSR